MKDVLCERCGDPIEWDWHDDERTRRLCRQCEQDDLNGVRMDI